MKTSNLIQGRSRLFAKSQVRSNTTVKLYDSIKNDEEPYSITVKKASYSTKKPLQESISKSETQLKTFKPPSRLAQLKPRTKLKEKDLKEIDEIAHLDSS